MPDRASNDKKRIPEDNIFYKIDLNISQENINIMDMKGETKTDCVTNHKIKKTKIKKKKKIIKNGKKLQEKPFAERGYQADCFWTEGECKEQEIQPFLNYNDVLWFPTKMSKRDPKKPAQQSFKNGKGMDGYEKKENKEGKLGYWATPNDFKLYDDDTIKSRQSERNLAIPGTIITHECDKLCWIDVDTSYYDTFIQHLVTNHPYYTSMSGKEGRVHIPFKMLNKPEFFPTTFYGVGEKCRHK